MLVFNLMEPEEEKSRLEYYLHAIHSSVKIPVVVMLIGNSPFQAYPIPTLASFDGVLLLLFESGTHADDKRCTSSYKKKLFQGMAQDWNERYPYLKHMAAIDAVSGKGAVVSSAQDLKKQPNQPTN